MPTRPTKGDHGTADAGSKGRGGQKATYGSSVSPDVAAGQAEAIGDDGDREGGDGEGDDEDESAARSD
jgi:hypothetical protein